MVGTNDSDEGIEFLPLVNVGGVGLVNVHLERLAPDVPGSNPILIHHDI